MLSCRSLSSKEPNHRVGIIIGKKNGNAVVRNRCRRRIREILHFLFKNNSFDKCIDMVVLPKKEATVCSFDMLKNAMVNSSFINYLKNV